MHKTNVTITTSPKKVSLEYEKKIKWRVSSGKVLPHTPTPPSNDK